jgi:hypothetical protein
LFFFVVEILVENEIFSIFKAKKEENVLFSKKLSLFVSEKNLSF